ncbi:hypothetical protein EJ04DRAFT_557871 [Polyplosphaeria fusca]|uniref:Uncharacterized protein n=1 Tax=Polyplosphaeria fusca TaxID=682080 RepID=A0A9P4QG31_9PLEO|nr:hypothetical protein EJ04DRAFT_557871 [Polyplosphaeria fusca]
MAKSRFRARHSALKPEWLLDGIGSESPASAAVSENIRETASRPASQIQTTQHYESRGKSSDSMTAMPEAHSQAPPAQASGLGRKSRYSKSHTAAWTMASASKSSQTVPGAIEAAESLSKPRRNPSVDVQAAQRMRPSSPRSKEPPAPTKPKFFEDHVRGPTHLGRTSKLNRNARNPSPSTASTVPSPYSGADAPAQAPYIAPAYTPTSPV